MNGSPVLSSDRVVRKHIVDPVDAGHILPLALAVFAGLWWGPYIILGPNSPVGVLWVIFGSFISALIALIVYGAAKAIWKTQKTPELVDETRRRMIEFIGQEPRHINVTAVPAPTKKNRLVASGIAITEGCVLVVEDGEIGQIPLALVRGWDWRLKSKDQIETFGNVNTGTAVAVGMANEQREHEARLGSGFFLSVKDVEKPRWQFRTMDEPVLRKWAEIFKSLED